jgi:hypothetical protein
VVDGPSLVQRTGTPKSTWMVSVGKSCRARRRVPCRLDAADVLLRTRAQYGLAGNRRSSDESWFSWSLAKWVQIRMTPQLAPVEWNSGGAWYRYRPRSRRRPQVAPRC